MMSTSKMLSTASRLTCLLLLALIALTRSAQAQTAFSYSGKLASTANGNYDFRLTLYSAATAGSVVGSPVTISAVPVTSGNFTLDIDFGATSFANAPLWMQVAYRPSGTTNFTNLSGRVLETSRFSLLSLLSANTLAIGGYPVSSAAPASGQALVWNGSTWGPATVSGGNTYQAGAGLSLNGNVFSIANGGVIGSMLAAGSVTSAAIASGAVTSAAIASGAVTASAIASGAVTSVAIASGAVTSAALANGSVTSSALAAGAVTTPAVTNASITAAKLSGTGASAGQTLSYNGSAVVWSTPSNGGLTLPYSGSASSSNAAFSVSNTGSGDGVDASSVSGSGVSGSAPGGYGVYGITSTGLGVYGVSSSTGVGVYGSSTSGDGGDFISFGSGNGVYGSSTNGNGVYGASNNSVGGYFISGGSSGGTGVHGISTNGSQSCIGGYFEGWGNGWGVYSTSDNSIGVYGYSTSGTGVWGQSGNSNSDAGYFYGNVGVTGTLTAAAKNFKIDHPLDPANKYLLHSCIESDQMANLYSGNVTTDSNGDAVVDLPDWFEALNKDFRYQLTVIGQFAQAVISQEIHNHQFAIKTDKPHVKVSWQVTGIRQDAYARAHPLEVEQDKPRDKRGKFLHPREYGQSEEMGEDYETIQRHTPRPHPAPVPAPGR